MGNERRGESQSFEMKAGLLVLLLSVAGLQNVDAAGFVLSTEDPSKPGGWDAAMGWMVCPANHHVVDTHSECITAAADLGIGCGSEPEDLANWPKGCYVKPDGDYNVVMFNAHTTGGTANNDAAPICAPDAPSFVMGTPGTLATCPAGHAVVGTQSECETAAADLGLTFGLSEDDANWPKGCYLSIDASRFYFNTHATGAANAGATPICSDAPFVLGAKNTNGIASCPDYYSIVDAEAECSTAAEELTGFSITIADVQAVADWPKGCYTWNGNPYFNTHATGAAHAEATPICARDASTEVDMWGRVADGFVLGAPGTLAECMDHYHVVDTEAECAKTAADLEESSGYGGTEDVDDFPKGCYSQAISTSGTQVFFNAYAAGAANADASPICAPDFVRGTFQGCPYNYPMISMDYDLNACNEISGAMGFLQFLAIDAPTDGANWPRGCFFDLSSVSMAFNAHATGADDHPNARPICEHEPEKIFTCQDIKTDYKKQLCCNDPSRRFVVPSNARRLQRTSRSQGGWLKSSPTGTLSSTKG